MPYKEQAVNGVGVVRVTKRRRVKHLKVRLDPRGDIHVTIPYWLPYASGFQFAWSKRDWIAKSRTKHIAPSYYAAGTRIGKAHVLEATDSPKIRVGRQVISVPANHLPTDSPSISLQRAGERALKRQAEALLPKRLEALAMDNNFKYKDVSVKKMTSRWGSCSSENDIALSIFLIQLPWDLIDYVLLHELAHTVQHNHSPQFWQLVENHMPDYKTRRRALKQNRPTLIPINEPSMVNI